MINPIDLISVRGIKYLVNRAQLSVMRCSENRIPLFGRTQSPTLAWPAEGYLSGVVLGTCSSFVHQN